MCGQVGINTNDPQQALHLGSTDGTVRIEGLNHLNNSFNGGDLNGDADLSNDTFPLYVDDQGKLTLELKILENSEELDAFDNNTLPTTTITLPNSDSDGIASTVIKDYTITVNSARLLEIKYSLSFDVYLNATKAVLIDNKARRIYSYLTVSGQTREYGPSTKCYSSGSANSVGATFYNSSTAYITLPAAGTYTVSLHGAVSSGIRSGGGPGGPSLDTYVEFATGNDFVFMRLH